MIQGGKEIIFSAGLGHLYYWLSEDLARSSMPYALFKSVNFTDTAVTDLTLQL